MSDEPHIEVGESSHGVGIESAHGVLAVGVDGEEPIDVRGVIFVIVAVESERFNTYPPPADPDLVIQSNFYTGWSLEEVAFIENANIRQVYEFWGVVVRIIKLPFWRPHNPPENGQQTAINWVRVGDNPTPPFAGAIMEQQPHPFWGPEGDVIEVGLTPSLGSLVSIGNGMVDEAVQRFPGKPTKGWASSLPVPAPLPVQEPWVPVFQDWIPVLAATFGQLATPLELGGNWPFTLGSGIFAVAQAP